MAMQTTQETVPREIVWEGCDQFCIKTPEDKYDCWVPCILEFTATQLIMTDWGNSCLKIVDKKATEIKVTRRRLLRSKPWGITEIPESSFAVTFPDVQLIKFFTAGLEDCENPKQIEVDGRCLGIQYINNNLFLSLISPKPKIQIVNVNGEMVEEIKLDECLWPMHFTVDQDRARIYVSDNAKHTLTCLSRTGDVNWEYKDQLKYPSCVASGFEGRIYVCSKFTRTNIDAEVHVVSTGGAKMYTIPLSHPSVNIPLAICCSRNQETLYLSSGVYEKKKKDENKDSPCNTITEFVDDNVKGPKPQDIQSTSDS